MAYLEPENLTCPSCGKTDDMIWVIGEGPNTKTGEGPDYIDVHKPGVWVVRTDATAPAWLGSISCPECSAVLKSKP